MSARPPFGRPFVILSPSMGDDWPSIPATLSGPSDDCTAIFFVENGQGNNSLWNLRNLGGDGKYCGFQNVATNEWIALRGNMITACQSFDPDSTVWEITPQTSDASLVHFPNNRNYTWQINTDGYLALGSAEAFASLNMLFSFGMVPAQ